MNDLVSIVLPVYNGERYLRESIDSVLAQTYTNFELIVVDDCSTDSTPDIVRDYAARDPRVTYHRNPQNLKLPKSLNAGFRLTKGDYLTWTSDDNRYRPNAIEFLVSELKKGDCPFVFTAFCRIDEDGNKIDDIVFDENAPKMLPARNMVGASFMYTRAVYETVGDYDEDLFLTEDFDYWQRIYGHFGAVYKKDIVYDYRLHAAALTGTRNEKKYSAALSKTLLKNRPLFGRLSLKQNHMYYQTLSDCMDVLEQPNPYKGKYKFYSFLYFVTYRIPRKLHLRKPEI